MLSTQPQRYTQGMTLLTTVKVSTQTRDELRMVADREGLTLDAALRMLLRAERQRQMGRDLAQRPAVDQDQEWVSASSAAVARAIG